MNRSVPSLRAGSGDAADAGGDPFVAVHVPPRGAAAAPKAWLRTGIGVCLAWVIGAATLRAQSLAPRVVSVPDPAAAGIRLTGNGESDSPRYSRDGRFLVFASSASDLATNDVNGFRRDVFVRELATGRTALASVTPAGVSGNGDSFAPDVSADGRYVAFLSRASDLVAGDTNRVADVFVRDMVDGVTVRASVATDGSGADGENHPPRLTPDGRVVVFGSRATNLDGAGPDTDGRVDVYVRQLGTGVTTLATGEARDGTNYDVEDYDVSDDGRWVAFRTISTNVVTGVPVRTVPSGAYVRDLQRGVTIRLDLHLLSVTGTRTTAEARSLVFAPGRPRLAVATWIAGTISTVSVTNVVEVLDLGEDGALFVGGSAGVHGPLLDEPTSLAFDRTGELLVYAQTVSSGQPAVLRAWRETGGVVTVTTVTNAATREPIQAREIAVSPGGERVAFTSSATNLASGGTPNHRFQLYLVEPATGRVELVTTNAVGTAVGGVEYGQPVFGSDGRLAFQSASDDLVGGDRNGAMDVFELELEPRRLTTVSTRVGAASEVAFGRSVFQPGGVSADGRRVLFASTADDLVAEDAKGQPDLFVRDLPAGRTLLVTVPGAEGGPSRPGFGEAVLAANGRFVAFTADLLVTGANGNPTWTPQVFVRDLSLGTTRAVALNPDGQPAILRTVAQLRIGADGRHVAFFTDATTLVEGSVSRGQVIVRDLATGRNWLVDTADPGPMTVALAGLGGRALATRLGSSSVRSVWLDPASGAREEFPGQVGMTAALSYDGRRIAFSVPGDGAALLPRVRWRDEGGTVFQEIPLPAEAAVTNALEAMSRDGRRLALRERGAALGMPRRATWALELESGTASRVDVQPDGTVSGSSATRWPSFSADGRFLAFQSASGDLVANDPNPVGDVFVRDLVAQRTTRVGRRSDGVAENDAASQPELSADGRRLVFASWSGGFVAGDDNGAGDVFAVDWEGSPAQDADADGLDDGWERTWFGNLARTGEEDFDGDGVTDRDEFRTGTCPLDDRSQFRLESVAAGVGERGLTWLTEPGRRYRVQASDVVTGADWVPVGEGVVGDGRTARVTVAVPVSGARYFRVALE